MIGSREESEKDRHLASLGRDLLGAWQVIVGSHRGPVEYQLSENGRVMARRSSGALISALSTLGQYGELTWVSSATGEGDRQAMEKAQGGVLRSPLPGQNIILHFVIYPRPVYHKYYNVVCNPLLWFLQHYLWNLPYAPNIDSVTYDAWENGYVSVNKAFAEAITAQVARSEALPLVLLQDFQLYLVGGYLRRQIPQAILQHFVALPWPTSSYWQVLPRSIRQEIVTSLCACDILGFQTRRDVHNFLNCCETLFPEAAVDYAQQTVALQGHLTRVKSYPASINLEELKRVAGSGRVRESEEKLKSLVGEQTIIRVDPLEPNRNIARGFRAFSLLLERHPELVGKVKFLAFLVPPRTRARQNQRYTEELDALMQAINNQRGQECLKVLYENNYHQSIAALRLYDVLLVNPITEGMNLVSKEGPAVNTRDGVLILSEGAGAWEELASGALGVSSADIEGMAQAFYTALTMPREERKQRADFLKKTIGEADDRLWLCRQLEDILKVTQGATAPTS